MDLFLNPFHFNPSVGLMCLIRVVLKIELRWFLFVKDKVFFFKLIQKERYERAGNC